VLNSYPAIKQSLQEDVVHALDAARLSDSCPSPVAQFGMAVAWLAKHSLLSPAAATGWSYTKDDTDNPDSQPATVICISAFITGQTKFKQSALNQIADKRDREQFLRELLLSEDRIAHRREPRSDALCLFWKRAAEDSSARSKALGDEMVQLAIRRRKSIVEGSAAKAATTFMTLPVDVTYTFNNMMWHHNMALRLLQPLPCAKGQVKCTCGAQVQGGYHWLSCSHAGGPVKVHKTLVALLGRFTSEHTAGLWIREPSLNVGGKRGDIKLDNFLGGQTLILDLTGVNNSLVSNDNLFASTAKDKEDVRLRPGRYGLKAAIEKRRENDAICKANGWVFQAFSYEALGGLDRSALLWAEQLEQAVKDLGPTEAGSMDPKGVKSMFIRKLASIHRKTLLGSVIDFSRKMSEENTESIEFCNDVGIPSWAEQCNDAVADE
jgi:hypothetical protein